MSRFPLAEIERVYAVQYKDSLMIVVEGYTSGSGGSFHIWKSRTKVFPPLFEIYAAPGIPESGSQTEPARVLTVAANTFHGIFNKIQVVCGNDRIFPKIIAATEEEYEPADAGDIKASEAAIGGVEQWFAVHQFSPGGSPKLRVEGSIMIPNLGVAPRLVRAEKQDIDPKTLLLNSVTEPLLNVQGDLKPKPVRSKVMYEEDTDYPFESVCIEPIHKIIEVENVHRSQSKAGAAKA